MNVYGLCKTVIVVLTIWNYSAQAYRPYRRCSRHAAKRWNPYSTRYAEKAFNAVTHHAPMAEIQRLVQSYPDVLQARDANGRTLLHWAAADGMVFAVELFLSLGADIDARDVRGNTPLHLAVANTSNLINRLNSITVLMDEGASPILRNENGLNTFDLAKKFTTQDHLYDLARHRVDLVRSGQAAGRRIKKLLQESQEEVERYFAQPESVSAEASRMRQGLDKEKALSGGFVRASELNSQYNNPQPLQHNGILTAYQPGDEFVSVFEDINEGRLRVAREAAAAKGEMLQ